MAQALSKRDKMISVRCSEATRKLIGRLSKKLTISHGIRCSQADVIELSVKELAKTYKVK
jgi:hypothetical protein